MTTSQKAKRIISLFIVTFLFFLFQTSLSFAKNDTSSGSDNSGASTQEVSPEVTDPATALPPSEEAVATADATATNDTSNNNKKSEEESPEAAVPESIATSMSSGGTSGSSTGGSLSIPEAVTVSQVGAATFSYPIAVPPGRNGLQPNIALSYSSYNGNGWLGVGWSLDLGSIKRSIKNGLDYSANDFMAGGSELVANNSWGTGYYCAKIEGAFTKYRYISESSGWIAYAKDGTKYYYGQTSASQMTNSNGTYSWQLDRVEDTNGNYMTITYTKSSNQIYPYQIAYTGNSGLSPNKTVEFELEDRDDDIQSYKTKALVTTSKRLKTITVKVGTSTVYKYSLNYEYSPGNGRSRLIDITRVDPDDPDNTMPPTEFFWTDSGDGTFGTSSTMSLAGVTTGGKIAFGDINGDGRDDFIKYCFTSWPVITAYPYLANSSGGFDLGTAVNVGYCFDEDSMRVVLSDINGDGRADIVCLSADGYFYAYLSYGDGTFSPGFTTPNQDGLVFIYLADLDGDGTSDLVKHNSSEGKVWTHLSNGDGTFESQGNLHTFSAGGTIHLGDFNGDGLTDLCLLNTVSGYSASLGFMLGDGNGSFVTPYAGFPLGPAGQSINGSLADVNGDGLADLVAYSDTGMGVYISTGTGMTGPYATTINGTASVADMNDDGMADVIVSNSSLGVKLFYQSKGDGTFNPGFPIAAAGNNLYLADINGDGRPDSIEYNSSNINYAFSSGDNTGDYVDTIINPLGGTTTLTYGNNSDINYTPSDTNRVPFTLHPVLEVETDGGYTSEISLVSYDYSGGYYDYEERDFRGFRTVTLINPDDTTVKTTYEQEDDYLKGRPLTIEMRDLCLVPSLFKEITYTWDTYPIPNADAEFVKLANKRVDMYIDTNVHTNEAYTYSNTHGGVLTTVTSGSGSAENVTFTNTYTNKSSWLWRKSSERVNGSSSGLVRRTNYIYNSKGDLLTKTYVNTIDSNPVETYTYDSYGNTATYKDPKNNITSYNYDTTKTHLTSINYPTTGGVAHSVSMDYNLFGKLDSETDENNNTAYYEYDEFGRLTEVNYPDGGQTKYEYNLTASPAFTKTRVLEEGSTYVDTWQYVDGYGRNIMNISKSTGSNYVVTAQHFDEMGRVDLSRGPYFTNTYSPYHSPTSSVYPTSEKTFDYMGRVLTVKTPKYQGSQSQFDTTYFDYDGFTSTITDADGNIRTEIKDYLGRIVEVQEDTSGGTTYYGYNAAGDLLEVEDDQGNITSITYNTLGQKLSMDDPDMGYWEYTYDLNSNLETQTDAKNQTITFSYDALNRITQKSYSTSDPTVYFYYDNISIANGRGRLYSVTNANVTTTYNDYDEMGRVLSVTKTISGDQARTTLFSYDLTGKQKRIVYPGGNYMVENFYYPGTNLLHKVTSFWGADYAEITDYTPSGKIRTLYHDNGSSTTYTYDARSEKLYQIETKNGSNVTIQKKRYDYTSIDEISSINDLHNGVIYSYAYDNLSRLTAENDGSTMSVTYSTIGNIESKTIGSNYFDYQYNDINHAHVVSRIVYNGNNYDFSYDANGNMEFGWDFTSPVPRSIGYNADNMPETVTKWGGATTSLLYDGMGTRVKKSVGSTNTYYISDYFEVRGGTNIKYIFAGNLRVAQIKGSDTSYFHKDHLGSSTVMTDNSGAEIESTNYMPFGSQRDHSGTGTSDYRFTDQELDAENGLYNYNARLYDPFIGRFISPDTIVPDSYNPQSLNRYSYCLNDPLIYTDPSGHTQMTAEEAEAAYAEMQRQLDEMYQYYSEVFPSIASVFLIDPVPAPVDPWSAGFEELDGWLQEKALMKAFNESAGGSGGNKPSYEGFYGLTLRAFEIQRHDFVMKQIKEYSGTIEKKSKQYGVDPNLVRAIIYEEQTHNKSPWFEWVPGPFVNSVGPMAINKKNWDGYNRLEMMNPSINIDVGTAMLGKIVKGLGNDYSIVNAAGMYNSGASFPLIIPKQSREYGLRVKRFYNMYFDK